MTALRISKALLVAGIALTCSLVALGNAVDPAGNLDFVRHVLAMDTVEPASAIRGRAVTDPALQGAVFALIVAGEALVAGLCWIGAARMALAARAPAARYAAARTWALAGLTLGVLLFQTGFMGIGGEWFGMWMSKTWNGQEDAFRFAMILLGALIYVALPEGETRTAPVDRIGSPKHPVPDGWSVSGTRSGTQGKTSHSVRTSAPSAESR